MGQEDTRLLSIVTERKEHDAKLEGAGLNPALLLKSCVTLGKACFSTGFSVLENEGADASLAGHLPQSNKISDSTLCLEASIDSIMDTYFVLSSGLPPLDRPARGP